MQNIKIYQLQSSLLNFTLPKIIIRILKISKKITYFCKNKDEINNLNDLMKSFFQVSFSKNSTEFDTFKVNLQRLIITENLNYKLIKNRQLISSHPELLCNINVTKNVFLIIRDVDNYTIENLYKIFYDELSKKSIRYFKQKYNNLWEIHNLYYKKNK